eukprot:scaffold104923_cov90-Phaeocystis_antarctica.AAC.2
MKPSTGKASSGDGDGGDDGDESSEGPGSRKNRWYSSHLRLSSRRVEPDSSSTTGNGLGDRNRMFALSASACKAESCVSFGARP